MPKLATIVLAGCFCLRGNHASATAEKFLLLNYAPDGFSTAHSSSNLMHYVHHTFGDANAKSSLKVGVACLYPAGASWTSVAKELALLTNDLAMAERLDVPLLIQVDTETWLPSTLLNWYDPGQPGFDPAKKADVEWFGWHETNAVKLCWRNWGTPFRIGPAPNFLSARFQAYEREVYDQFLPVVREWFSRLATRKRWLFVGWKCGWESAINGNYRYFTNGNACFGTTNNPRWSEAYQPLGYNAAQTGGIRNSGILTASENAKIVGRHLAYLARLASDSGIPRNKIFVHGTVYGTSQQNQDALANPFSNPGVSFYGRSDGSLKFNSSFIQALQAAKQNYRAVGYGYGEFNLFTTNYNTWNAWFQKGLAEDPDCVFQALYNYDSVFGIASVEQALLDAMASNPATNAPPGP